MTLPTNTASAKERRIAYLYLTITICAWGSLYVVSKFVLGKLPTFTILFLRYFIAVIALRSILRNRILSRIEPKDYKCIFFIGFAGYFLSTGAQLLGTKLSNASLASLINSMNPVFIILAATIILKEQLTAKKVVAVVAAITGTYIVIGGVKGTGQIAGILVSLLSVVTWAITASLVRQITQKYDPITITTLAIQIAMLCALPLSLYEMAHHPNLKAFDWTVVVSMLYIGIVCTAVAHVFWNKSLSVIEAGNCSLFYPLQPMVSVILGCLLLREHINAAFILGAVLIIGGVLFSVIGKDRMSDCTA